MGLDMYLHKRTYVGNKYRKPEELIKIKYPKEQGDTYHKIVDGEIDDKKISYIEEEVGYWRKANAVHNWFIENCGDGDQDKDTMYVSEEDIIKLREVCEMVLSNTELSPGLVHNGDRGTANGWEPIMDEGYTIEDSTLAEELLPTTSGFFFGSTEYDQYYLDDLFDTVEIIDAVLSSPGRYKELEYHASW